MNTKTELQKRTNEPVPQPARRTVAPHCEVHETDSTIQLTAEMPGVDASAAEVTLERDLLTIAGRTSLTVREGFRLLWREFEPVDYRRSFQLSGPTEPDGMRASMQNGILRVEIKKAAPTQRKIPVTTG
jgi:HSP20 family protein